MGQLGKTWAEKIILEIKGEVTKGWENCTCVQTWKL